MNIPIKVDPQGAEQKIGGVERSLAKLEDEAAKAQQACNSLSGTFKRIADHERAMAAETAKVKSAMDGLGGSFARIGQLQIGQTLAATGKAFAGLTAQIAHEQRVLESIHGPMKQYQQDLATLDVLLKRGEISQAQHAARLAQSRSSAGMANPMDAVSLGAVPRGRDHMAGASSAMMGVGIAGFAAKSVLDLSDSYTNLENRLRGVSAGQNDLNALMDKTKGIADRTRSDWGATAESYVRLINATKALGISQDRGLKITETLNMALQSSGASSSEAAAGTLQLMQGLSSGALAGDEFRSIAEQLPDLLDVFAKQMGVSRGELKKLGAEGKITADIVVKALESSATAIETKFNASTATASQQWTVLKNQMMESAGTFVQNTGVMSTLGDVVGGITTGLGYFGKAMDMVGGALDALGPVGDGIRLVIEGVLSPLTTTVKVVDALDAGLYELAKASTGAQTAMEAFAEGVRLGSDPLRIMVSDLERLHAELTKNQNLSFGPGGFIDGLVGGLNRIGGVMNDNWGPSLFEKGLERVGFKAKGAKAAVSDLVDELARARADADTAWIQELNDRNAAQELVDEDLRDQTFDGPMSLAESAAKRDAELRNNFAPQGGNSLDGGIKQATEEMTKFDIAVKELNDGSMADLKASAMSVGDAFVDWMFDAEFSWKRFSEQMAKDMAKMAARQAIQFGFAALAGGATGFDSMVGGGRGPFLPGFATGGDMMVGGAGGTDSRIAAFRVTPGESIHVRTPEQRQAAQGSGRGRTVVVENRDGSSSRYVMADDIEELVIRSVDRNAPALRNRLTGR